MVNVVPSGNFGNITADVRMKNGAPVKRFIAANNSKIYFIKNLRLENILPDPRSRLLPTLWIGDPVIFSYS